MARERLRVFYNCDNCPSYCCSYPLIAAQPADVTRLAKHFGLPVAVARKRFTKIDEGRRVLRHQLDEHYGSVCRFLDLETRRCGVYEARPGICREYPGTARCGYYDFLMHERRTQEDPVWVARAYNPDRP